MLQHGSVAGTDVIGVQIVGDGVPILPCRVLVQLGDKQRRTGGQGFVGGRAALGGCGAGIGHQGGLGGGFHLQGGRIGSAACDVSIHPGGRYRCGGGDYERQGDCQRQQE